MLTTEKKGLSNCADYCQSYFLQGYDLGHESLSELSETYPVTSAGQGYILKYIQPRNLISIVDHNCEQIKQICALAETVNKNCDLIATIDVVDMQQYGPDTVLLLRKQNLTNVSVKTEADFFNLGKALKEFHVSASSIPLFSELPWMNFPKNFIDTLKSDGRWQEVDSFLKNWAYIQESVAVTTNHNDIHVGNVYRYGPKIFLLDLDEVCSSGFCNDLGMAVANFWNLNETDENILGFVRAILRGYKMIVNQDDIRATLVYALRKLYFTEAYFIFISRLKDEDHVDFINDLWSREKQIKGLIASTIT